MKDPDTGIYDISFIKTFYKGWAVPFIPRTWNAFSINMKKWENGRLLLMLSVIIQLFIWVQWHLFLTN